MADNTIPLDRHAVIEASAGTGKTHTIMELVKRLLFEKKVPLASILLVTYTEKATGELKARLLEELEKALREDPANSALARQALDAFDQAAIFTIHGFCQRVLQENSFAHGQDFASEMVDDGLLAESVLREVQRKNWTGTLRESLARVLTVSAYDGESWEGIVHQVSQSFKRSCHHLLRPSTPDRIEERFDTIEHIIQDAWRTARPYAGEVELGTAEGHPWVIAYRTMTEVHGTDRKSAEKKLLVPLIDWLADERSDGMPIERTLEFLDQAAEATGFEDDGLRRMLRRRNGEFVDAEARCPGLEAAIKIVDEMFKSCEFHTIRCLLTAWTIIQLQDGLKEHKRDRGLQSFDDMLDRLDEALEESSEAASHLRQRYRYAIVDEFQDTDPVQWRIFERVFAAGDGEHRLFVVGDPKQSIFGFRGADVQAYHQACQRLTGDFAAESRTLGTNWRSSAGLIRALNVLFDNGEFFTDPGITYKSVEPAGDKCPYQVKEDQTDNEDLTLIRWDEETARRGRTVVSRAVVAEIHRLLGNGRPLLTYSKSGKTFPLKAGDICVLVGKRNEARPLLDALRAAGLPYSFYKEPGLWQTDEAEHLETLLTAVARPDQPAATRLALLTRFFRIDPLRIRETEDLPAIRERFDGWRDLAADLDWSGLFHSIIYDTGVLFSWSGEPDAERRRANLLHVSADLEQEAYRNDLDLLDLLDRLRERRQGGGQDGDLQPIETDRSKIRIMTIHASKGLEFPVVFLLGGFTDGRRPDFYSYREDGRRVFDLRKKVSAAKDAHDREERLESERLLYVALTRAIFKLYVPLKGETKVRAPGPLIEVVGTAISTAGLVGHPDVTVRDVQEMSLRKSRATKASATDEAPAPQRAVVFKGPLVEAGLDILAVRRTRLESFSSLNRRLESTRPHYAAEKPRSEDEPETPDIPDPFRGPVFGDILHDVLETADWSEAARANSGEAFADRIAAELEAARVSHWPRFPPAVTGDPAAPAALCRVVAAMAWQALTTPLPEVGRLCELPERDRLHELEFQFPYDETPPAIGPERETIFLRGYVDLVFRKGGRYYLLDWKSNYLQDGYASMELDRAMQNNGYDRQCRLYLVALSRWLARNVKDFELAKHLGGAFYLFVRGMTGTPSPDGVYFRRPTQPDLNLAAICSH